MSRKRTPPRLSDADALLAAVWADPHSDTPRLVYADYIEERGDAARAKFIRLQIARDVAEAAGEDVSDEAHRWEEELLPLPRRDWPQPEKSGVYETYEHGGYFLRGFPAPVVSVTASAAGRVPAGTQRVWATWAKPGGLPNLLRSGGVRGVSEVWLWRSAGQWTPEEFADLAGPDRLDQVAGLYTGGGSDAAHLDWASSLALAGLRRVGLFHCSPAVVFALGESPVAKQITELDLGNAIHGAGDLAWLGASTSFLRLRTLRLHLGGNSEWGSEPAAFLRSPLAAGLRELRLGGYNSANVDDLCHALAAGPPPNLWVLRVPFASDAARQILPDSAQNLAQLREIHVRPFLDSSNSRDAALRLKSAFGDRLRPAHLWRAVPAG